MSAALPFISTCCQTCTSSTDSATAVNLTGNGSPEGVETADPGTIYWDLTGHSLWIKNTGVGTDTGWEQLIA